MDGLQAPPHYLSSMNYRDLKMGLKGKVQTERLTKEKDKLSPGALQLLFFFQAQILLWLSVFVGVSYTLPLLLKTTNLKSVYVNIPALT